MIIDKEFKQLVDRLDDSEFEGLERKILEEGFKEPVVVWEEEGILIDGHNRVAICEKHNIECGKRYISLPDRNAAKNWIADNQLSRRNLHPNRMSYLRGTKYNIAKKMVGRPVKETLSTFEAPVTKKKGGDIVSPPFLKTYDKIAAKETLSTFCVPVVPVVEKNNVITETTLFSERTCDKMAKKADVSSPTIVRDGQYAKALDQITAKLDTKKIKIEPRKDVIILAKKPPEEQERIIEVIKEKDIPIKQAVVVAKKEEVVEKLNSIEVIEVKKIEGVFDTIVIDIPWPMQKIERSCRLNQVGFDYPVMSIEDIKSLNIPCADNSHVWLWTTQKFLPIAFDCLKAWNLKYVCTFVWHKPGGFQVVGLPQYNTEFALYARRGTPTFTTTKAFSTCFNAPRGKHSEKPIEFYDMVL